MGSEKCHSVSENNSAFVTFTCYFGTRNIHVVVVSCDIITETTNFDMLSLVKYSQSDSLQLQHFGPHKTTVCSCQLPPDTFPGLKISRNAVVT